MKDYHIYQRYVASFGGSRLDQFCDVRVQNNGKLELRLQESIIGKDSAENISALAKRVVDRVPFQEGDVITTMDKQEDYPVAGFEGMGIFLAPQKKLNVNLFEKYLLKSSEGKVR